MSEYRIPAFPLAYQHEYNGSLEHHVEPGMSLRDYFAAHFMGRAQILSESDGGWNFDTAAQCAYEMADAMLKARES